MSFVFQSEFFYRVEFFLTESNFLKVDANIGGCIKPLGNNKSV